MRSRLLFILGLACVFIVGFLVLGDPAPDAGDSERAEGWIDATFESFVAKSRAAPFPPLRGPWTLALPADHGGHPSARSETWGLIAHLEGAAGAPLGLQFSMARLGLVPPDDETGTPDTALFRAHAIVTDGAKEIVTEEERFSRGLGAAGHDNAAGEVFLDDWTLGFDGSGTLTIAVRFRETDLPVALTLTPLKPADAATGSEALRGYTLPRFNVTGTLGEREVTGTALLSHLWGDVPLPGAAVANDLLTLALDDGSDLSIVRTTRQDGRGGAVLDGAVFGAAGETTSISEASYEATPLSEDGRAWRLSGPGLDLKAETLLPPHAAEFVFGFETGLLRISGTHAGAAVSGLGTLQRSFADD